MTFTDTHTHLYLEQFENGGRDAVKRAIDAGVTRMIFPNVNLETIGPMESLAAEFPDNISVAMGMHPTDLSDEWRAELDEIDRVLAAKRYVAVGEVGIDMYWDKTHEDRQMQAFDHQVAKAVELNLPVIIHCREGLSQTLEVLQGHSDARAVFHSFGGSVQDVEAIRRVGDYYFGINGVVTFKNSGLHGSLDAIGLDRILLETDSPYLTPVPHRGKRNESAYLLFVAECIAQTLGVSVDHVAETTNSNASTLFFLNPD